MTEGHAFGKYTVSGPLGQGGYATVYRARDRGLDREVALKLLDPVLLRDPAFVQRFQREARAAARLRHPHIVTIHELGEVDGRYYIAMELVPGPSLKEKLRDEGPLPWEGALPLLRQVAEALDYAHQLGVVHRDLKPANILLDPRAGAVLTDFGMARLVGDDSMTLTLSGGVVGTPAYIPVEVWEGEPAEPAADVYALACILVEMLTGRPLFEGDTPIAVMRLHDRGAQLPGQWPAGVPAGIEELLLAALAKEPAARTPSAGALADALAALGSRVEPLDRPRIQPAPAAPAPGPLRTQLAPGVWIEWVEVPAGEFLMGSSDDDQGASKDEKPQRSVYLDCYRMGKYPVTNAQYQAFVKATGHRGPGHWEKGAIPAGKEAHPVVDVSWEDAVAFCRWAAQSGGQEVRLPTEAEWEKAARGTDGRIYPWGNRWDPDRCNKGGGLLDLFTIKTTPVGRYSPAGDSPYGCADMAGNVWEWCADWYQADYYASAPAASPTGPASGQYRVLRGGAWLSNERDLRAAFRYWLVPSLRDFNVGFRCASSSP